MFNSQEAENVKSKSKGRNELRGMFLILSFFLGEKIK